MSTHICGIWILLGGCLLLIYIYGKIVETRFNGVDPLRTPIAHTDIDFWSFTHFVLFFVLGYLYPQYLPYWVIMGVIWEVVESVSGNPEQRKKMFGTKFDFKGDKYWYGKLTDVLIDIIGLACGYSLMRCL